MTRERTCPACRSTLPADPPAAEGAVLCPFCGAVVPPEGETPNPYAAPGSPPAEIPGESPGVPRHFLGKLAMAYRIFFREFFLFAPLVLFIWIPAGLFLNYYRANNASPENSLETVQLSMIMGAFFGPIPDAAIIYVLSRRMAGERVTLFDALSQGMNHWIPLFAARMVAGLFVFLGLIALIVPGIVLFVRFLLLDPVVVLERPADPRRRSAELVRGRGLEMLGALFFVQLLFLPVTLVLGALPKVSEALDNLWAGTAFTCTTAIYASTGTILLFLYYWEAAGRVGDEAPTEGPHAGD